MRGREAKASQLFGSALEFGARYRQGAGVLMDPQSSKRIAERPRWSIVEATSMEGRYRGGLEIRPNISGRALKPAKLRTRSCTLNTN